MKRMEQSLSQLLICFRCSKQDQDVKMFSPKLLEKCIIFDLMRKFHNIQSCGGVGVPETADMGIGYHSSCYRGFSAVGKDYQDVYYKTLNKSALDSSTDSGQSSLHSDLDGSNTAQGSTNSSQSEGTDSSRCSSSASGDTSERTEEDNDDGSERNDRADEKKCIYCCKAGRRSKGRIVLCSSTMNYEIMDDDLNTATELGDPKLCERVRSRIDGKLPIHYHRICRATYKQYIKQKLKSKETDWHTARVVHGLVLTDILIYVNNTVVLDKYILSLAYLKDKYVDSLVEKHKAYSRPLPQNISRGIFKTDFLLRKLLKELEGLVLTRTWKNRVYLIPLSRKNDSLNLDQLHSDEKIMRGMGEFASLLSSLADTNEDEVRKRIKPFVTALMGGFNPESTEECELFDMIDEFTKAAISISRTRKSADSDLLHQISIVSSHNARFSPLLSNRAENDDCTNQESAEIQDCIDEESPERQGCTDEEYPEKQDDKSPDYVPNSSFQLPEQTATYFLRKPREPAAAVELSKEQQSNNTNSENSAVSTEDLIVMQVPLSVSENDTAAATELSNEQQSNNTNSENSAVSTEDLIVMQVPLSVSENDTAAAAELSNEQQSNNTNSENSAVSTEGLIVIQVPPSVSENDTAGYEEIVDAGICYEVFEHEILTFSSTDENDQLQDYSHDDAHQQSITESVNNN